jgi:hypothetical protein
MARFLKDQVDLSEDQARRVETILDGAFREAMKRFVGRYSESEASPETIRRDMEELRQRVLADIREILDEGQKKELDALVSELDQRARTWRENREDPGRDVVSVLDPDPPSKERLLARVENALLLSLEERRVILPLVARVAEARRRLREGRRDRRRDLDRAIHAGAKSDEVRDRLLAIRERERREQDEVHRAQAELREVLTLEQEARLVALGVLD